MAQGKRSVPERRVIQIKRFQIGLNVLVQLAVVVGIVVMVNYLSFKHFKRWDFSRDQKYLLSDHTKQLLGSLKKPVTAVVFFNSGMEIAGDVMMLLREYEYASKKKLTTEVVDPYRNLSRARELQAKYKFGANENVLILDYEGRTKFVNAQDMAEMDSSGMMLGQPPQVKAFKGEQAITSALLEMTEEKQNKLYLLAGHGEPEVASEAGPGGTTESIRVLTTYIERQNIKIESLNLSIVDRVPDDARAIIILSPKYDFSEREMNLLREYWDKNGRLFVSLNPAHPLPRVRVFLTDNGITPQDDRVLRTEALGNLTGVYRDATGVVKGDSAVTDRLEGLTIQFLGQTQSIAIDRELPRVTRMSIAPLIEAGKGFWGETDYQGGENSRVFFDPKKDHPPPLALAAAAERGALSDVRVSVETSRLVIVGNGEFLKDEALTEAGLDFALSSINWLLNREILIGVAPKERKSFNLNLSENQLGNIALLVIGAIPGFVAALGFAQWWQRRT